MLLGGVMKREQDRIGRQATAGMHHTRTAARQKRAFQHSARTVALDALAAKSEAQSAESAAAPSSQILPQERLLAPTPFTPLPCRCCCCWKSAAQASPGGRECSCSRAKSSAHLRACQSLLRLPGCYPGSGYCSQITLHAVLLPHASVW